MSLLFSSASIPIDAYAPAHELPALRPRGRTFNALVSDLCSKHGVTRADLLGSSRCRAIVAIRHELALACVLHLLDWCGEPQSLPVIGRLMNLDHSSVLYAARKLAAARYGTNMRASVREIREAARDRA